MNRIISMVLVLTLIMCLVPASAFADDNDSDVLDNVRYMELTWDEERVVSEQKTAESVIRFPGDGNITSGWYYLDRDVTISKRITSITGDVNLILGDTYTLKVDGLYVPPETTLTIYTENSGTGKLYSHPSTGSAIGGYDGHDNGNIEIKGGTIDASSGEHCAGIGSNDDRKTGILGLI